MAIETYSLSIQGVQKQERNECVMHFKGDGVTADDTWNTGFDLVESFKNSIIDDWCACLPTSYYIERLVTRRVHPKGFSTEYHQQFQATDHAGTVSGNAQTTQVCPAVRLVPPMGTKSQGRIFMPCIAEGSIDGNIYTTAYKNAISAVFTEMIGPFNNGVANWNLTVYSRKLDIVSNVVNFNLSPRVGFQMRRRSPV